MKEFIAARNIYYNTCDAYNNIKFKYKTLCVCCKSVYDYVCEAANKPVFEAHLVITRGDNTEITYSNYINLLRIACCICNQAEENYNTVCKNAYDNYIIERRIAKENCSKAHIVYSEFKRREL